MAAFNKVNKLKLVLFWFLNSRKRKRKESSTTKPQIKKLFQGWNKRRIAFMEALFVSINRPRERALWMHPRTASWFEMVIESYDDELWYVNFRVTRETFAYILDKIEQDIQHQNTTMRLAITPKRRLALMLYYMASTAEYKTIANLFGVSRSFACLCVKEVCHSITKHLSNVIHFPRGNELQQVINGYQRKWGFPMCAGAIDGTHIPILAPTECHAEYVNRKGYHSMIMQAVVDSNYLYRDLVIGWPGSVHDARVFSNSEIFKKGNNKELFPRDLTEEIDDKEISPFLIADPAYPLLPWLIKRYPKNDNAPRKARLFNYRLSRARMTVENTFGRWKGRFIRFSKRVDMEIPTLVNVVLASSILHNICEVQNNNFLPQWEENNVIEEEAVQADDDLEMEGLDAHGIREALANHFIAQ